MRLIAVLVATAALSSCGNPGGLSDAEYNEYKQLGAPKILYSCKSTSATYPIELMQHCIDKPMTGECSKEAMEKAKTEVKVSHIAGVGPLATYNRILKEAQKGCDGEFQVLESKQ